MELNTSRRRSKNLPQNAVEKLTKSALRDGYLLEKEKIKNEIGDLEQIRAHLGLSQRKVCQLLLVDPSAWTRWLNTPGGAPPHIYQALRWLIELKKVNPEAAAPVDISSRVDFIHASTQNKIKSLESSIEMLERALSLAATQSATVQYAPAPVQENPRWATEIEALKGQMALLLATQKKSASPRSRAKPLKPKKKPARGRLSSKPVPKRRKIKDKKKTRKAKRRR